MFFFGALMLVTQEAVPAKAPAAPALQTATFALG